MYFKIMIGNLKTDQELSRSIYRQWIPWGIHFPLLLIYTFSEKKKKKTISFNKTSIKKCPFLKKCVLLQWIKAT